MPSPQHEKDCQAANEIQSNMFAFRLHLNEVYHRKLQRGKHPTKFRKLNSSFPTEISLHEAPSLLNGAKAC